MEEVLPPDPTNLVAGLAYIDTEARLGHFAERSDLDVFRYLWINCWHTASHRGKPVTMGQVLEGKVRVEAIAAATMLGERSVNRSLARLAQQGWILREQGRFESASGPGWKFVNEVYVLMDPTGHRERARNRDIVGGFEALLSDSDRVSTILDTP
jgi:predicted transcriptional regulator